MHLTVCISLRHLILCAWVFVLPLQKWEALQYCLAAVCLPRMAWHWQILSGLSSHRWVNFIELHSCSFSFALCLVSCIISYLLYFRDAEVLHFWVYVFGASDWYPSNCHPGEKDVFIHHFLRRLLHFPYCIPLFSMIFIFIASNVIAGWENNASDSFI